MASSSTTPLLAASAETQDVGYGTPAKSDETARPSNSVVDDDTTSDFDEGVKQADAVNQVWSRSALTAAYFFIFLSSLANTLQYQIMSNLLPFVVSEFSSHSLIPTIGIVSTVIGGLLQLPIAKCIDIWGRPQGLAAMIGLTAFALLLMAACQNVEAYAAAQILYQIGISGFSYVLEIIVSDTSSLKNRALALSFTSTPAIITTFIGPPIAKMFQDKNAWRWAFTISAVCFALPSLPIMAILINNTRKARRIGIIPPSRRHKWSLDTVQRYLVEFDAAGVFLLAAGLTLFLVPISVTGTESVQLHPNSMIATLSCGAVFLVAFGLHERYSCPKPFVAFELICNRNVLGACLVDIALFVAYFSWDGYYTSYLQVVHDLDITQAGYIGHIYGFMSSFWCIAVGYLIRRTDRFKWLAWAALPVEVTGGIMMIFFRRPETHVAWLILCQVFIGLAGSTLISCGQIAMMSVAEHGDLAALLAILHLASYIGSALGSSFSGAIWNSTLPSALARLLPNMSPEELNAIGSDLRRQLGYPIGHPIRTAIITAYGEAQQLMCIAGLIASCLSVIAVIMWRDVRVSQSTQVKGLVL